MTKGKADNQGCSNVAHSWGEIYSKHAKSLNDESTQITYSEKRVNDSKCYIDSWKDPRKMTASELIADYMASKDK